MADQSVAVTAEIMDTPTPQQIAAQRFRNMAEWYDEHPTAPVPDEVVRISIHVKHPSRELYEFLGETIEDINDVYNLYSRNVIRDGWILSFYTGLKGVASKKVVGKVETEVIAWTLNDDIAPTPAQVADADAQ